MNPGGMMQFMAAMNSFKNAHPKFAAFVGMIVKGGIPVDSVIEVTITRPGEDPITANMKVQQSDIEMLNSLKNITQ